MSRFCRLTSARRSSAYLRSSWLISSDTGPTTGSELLSPAVLGSCRMGPAYEAAWPPTYVVSGARVSRFARKVATDFADREPLHFAA